MPNPRHHPTPSRNRKGDPRAAPPPRPNDRQSKRPEQVTRRGTNRSERPYQRPAREPREGRASNGNWRGGGATTTGLQAHKHTTITRCSPKGQPDRARGTHRRHGMAYQQARTRDTGTGQPATSTARDAREEQQGGGGGQREAALALPSQTAASAARTPTGHCTRQGSSGAQRYTPTPRLGSLRARPWVPRATSQ